MFIFLLAPSDPRDCYFFESNLSLGGRVSNHLYVMTLQPVLRIKLAYHSSSRLYLKITVLQQALK